MGNEAVTGDMTSDVRAHLAAYRERSRIPCVRAMQVAADCAAPVAAVGQTAGSLGIRVSACQLGLFGYEEYGDKRWIRIPATIPEDLMAALCSACVGGRLSCAAAWRLADGRGLPRLLIGSVADAAGVRITDCQLGCF